MTLILGLIARWFAFLMEWISGTKTEHVMYRSMKIRAQLKILTERDIKI